MAVKLVKNIVLLAAEAILPLHTVGRPRVDHSILLDQFLRVLTTGMPWRSLNQLDFRTAHRHFMKWARSGVFEDAYRRLLALSRRSKKDGSYMAIDTSFVKNVFGVECVGRNPTDRGRKATKVVALVDDRGLPHQLGFVPANTSDHKCLSHVLPFPNQFKGVHVYADKGFDSQRTREEIKRQGCIPVVYQRGKEVPWVWRRRRQVVERFFGILDKCRRLILRYDTTVVAYKAWVWLGSCRIAGNHLRRSSVRSN